LTSGNAKKKLEQELRSIDELGGVESQTTKRPTVNVKLVNRETLANNEFAYEYRVRSHGDSTMALTAKLIVISSTNGWKVSQLIESQ